MFVDTGQFKALKGAYCEGLGFNFRVLRIMAAYAVVDVDIYDIAQFLQYQKQVAPLLRAAGATYLARGGEQRVYEGDYEPYRLILVRFPSLEEMDAFYEGDGYQSLQEQRKACCDCRVIAVEGLEEQSPQKPGST